MLLFFFSSRGRHTRLQGDWSSDVCSSDLEVGDHDEQRGVRVEEWEALARSRPRRCLDDRAGRVERQVLDRLDAEDRREILEIGRASCRERAKMSEDEGDGQDNNETRPWGA